MVESVPKVAQEQVKESPAIEAEPEKEKSNVPRLPASDKCRYRISGHWVEKKLGEEHGEGEGEREGEGAG